MNNKDVMVGSIKEAWLLYSPAMCPTTFSLACTASVLAVMKHLMNEQASHEETKALLKERMAHQGGLELRLGNALRNLEKATAEGLAAVSQLNRLQSEIDTRQTYIEQLESMLERKLNEDKK